MLHLNSLQLRCTLIRIHCNCVARFAFHCRGVPVSECNESQTWETARSHPCNICAPRFSEALRPEFLDFFPFATGHNTGGARRRPAPSRPRGFWPNLLAAQAGGLPLAGRTRVGGGGGCGAYARPPRGPAVRPL